MDKEDLDQVSRVIALHPAYYGHFVNTHRFIMCGDGPLPYTVRHYFAIMVCITLYCSINWRLIY